MVLKKLRPKTRRAVLLFPVIVLFALCMITMGAFYPYINVNLVSNFFSFLSSTANTSPPFYGENIDMSQILPSSQHYVVNSRGQDLIDIAANLGINLIRITNVQRSFTTNADSVYTGAQWNQVLDKMQGKGIKAIILIEVESNNPDYYAPDIRPAYLHLVQEYIDSGVFPNSDVYAVDLKNEPLLTDANIKMLQIAHNMIKLKYPTLKQTIGWWATPQSSQDPYDPNNYNWSDFSGGRKIASLVDYYSIHMYGLAPDSFKVRWSPELKTVVFLSEVEHGLQTRKPILIEEFGEANGDAVSDQDTIGSPQLQASVYQGVYQALKKLHSDQILGAMAFDFSSRNQYPDAWAIVKNHGNYLFPAAYVLQEYATGKNNPSLQKSISVLSQNYLFTNADNSTSKNLQVEDRIGLRLRLDEKKHYMLFLNARGILRPIELFFYFPVTHTYDVVYQAVSKGSVQLSVVPDTGQQVRGGDPSSVYTLTINAR